MCCLNQEQHHVNHMWIKSGFMLTDLHWFVIEAFENASESPYCQQIWHQSDKRSRSYECVKIVALLFLLIYSCSLRAPFSWAPWHITMCLDCVGIKQGIAGSLQSVDRSHLNFWYFSPCTNNIYFFFSYSFYANKKITNLLMQNLIWLTCCTLVGHPKTIIGINFGVNLFKIC